MWSEGQGCSPERHGQITGLTKAEIITCPSNHEVCGRRKGRTLAVMQVSDGSQSFNAVTLDTDVHDLKVLHLIVCRITIQLRTAKNPHF